MKSNLKNKLKKLSKAEMKKRNLFPRARVVTGDEVIKTFRSSNQLPYLPKTFSDLKIRSRQNKAQAFYFVQGSKINQKTNAHIRKVLQKKEGRRVVIGGIVSGFSANGLRILVEFPRTLRIVGDNGTDVETIDSHIWLKLKECVVVVDDKSRTISLGDFLIVEGEASSYISKGEKRYSLKNWGIVKSGLLASREDENLNILEDYSRVGWIYKLIILDYDNNQGEMFIQKPSQIKKDEEYLIELFRNTFSFHLKKH